MSARQDILFAEIDKLRIHDSAAIDEFETDSFDDEIKPCESLQESVLNYLFGENKITGLELPWFGLENEFVFRPSELTIWNGINGHGKSFLLGLVQIALIKQGALSVIASFEMQPAETIIRMVSQVFGIEKKGLTEKAILEFFQKANQRLWLYTETGDVEPKRVKAMARYVREVLKADHLVIDSLMKCGIDEEDYSGQKRFVNSLQNIAKDTGLHIHLVTHAKKGKDESDYQGKFGVSGSASITNLADNVFIVRRNKKKELEKDMKESDEKIMQQHDVFLHCEKQRHGSWEGTIGLYWHPSGQYTRQEGYHRPLW